MVAMEEALKRPSEVSGVPSRSEMYRSCALPPVDAIGPKYGAAVRAAAPLP
jgi:hypothetical protein